MADHFPDVLVDWLVLYSQSTYRGMRLFSEPGGRRCKTPLLVLSDGLQSRQHSGVCLGCPGFMRRPGLRGWKPLAPLPQGFDARCDSKGRKPGSGLVLPSFGVADALESLPASIAFDNFASPRTQQVDALLTISARLVVLRSFRARYELLSHGFLHRFGRLVACAGMQRFGARIAEICEHFGRGRLQG
jgi:hypothetical protein